MNDEDLYHLWVCEDCNAMWVTQGSYPSPCGDCESEHTKLVCKTEKYPEYNDIFPQA